MQPRPGWYPGQRVISFLVARSAGFFSLQGHVQIRSKPQWKRHSFGFVWNSCDRNRQEAIPKEGRDRCEV